MYISLLLYVFLRKNIFIMKTNNYLHIHYMVYIRNKKLLINAK